MTIIKKKTKHNNTRKKYKYRMNGGYKSKRRSPTKKKRSRKMPMLVIF